MLKNRTRSSKIYPTLKPITGTVYNQYYNGALTRTIISDNLIDFAPYLQRTSIIVDQVNNPPLGRPLIIDGKWSNVPPFKYVSHEKFEVYPYSDLRATFSGTMGPYGDAVAFEGLPIKAHGFGWCTPYTTNKLSGLDVASLKSFYSASGHAFVKSFMKKEMLTDHKAMNLKDDLNLLLSLAEIADIKRLPQLLLSWKSRADKLVTDKFLGYQFGLLPVISDAKAIFKRLLTLDSQIDRWNKAAVDGRTLNMHAYLPIPPYLLSNPNLVKSSNGQPVTDTGGYNLVKFNRTVKTISTTYRYYPSKAHTDYDVIQEFSCKASIYFKPLPIFPSKVDDLKRSIYGLNKPIQALWGAIPFSFVVDWFVDVGKIIDRFASGDPIVQFQLVDAGYSIHVKTQIIARCTIVFDGGRVIPAGGCVETYDSYTRIPIPFAEILSTDSYYGPLKLKSLSTDQVILGSALAHQLLTKKH